MSQLKSKPVKVHSKFSSEKLSSDSQASKQKTKSLKRQHTSNRPLRKVSPQRNGKHESSINGVDSVEDLSSKVEIAKINLKTLQKIDAGIARIVSTVPHVELYQYKSDENMWERTSYEGTLFVFMRDTSAIGGRGFMILNRLNSENTQEHILAGMEFREQYPFLLYKRKSGDIFGLCIKDDQLFKHAGELLNRLSDESYSPISYEAVSSLSSSPQTFGGSQSPVSRTEGPLASGEESLGVCAADMDLQEVASRSYLGGQCFSDDTEGSVEGAEPFFPGKAERNDFSCGQSNQNAGALSHSVIKVPAVNGVKGPPAPSSPKETVSGSSSVLLSVQASPRNSHRRKSRSPESKRTPSNKSPAASHSKRSPMKHAASLDEGKDIASRSRSAKLSPIANGFSSSIQESIPYSAGTKATMSNDAAMHPNAGPPTENQSGTSDSIVRKLFPPSTSFSLSSSSGVMSPAVQTLFSRANNPQPASMDYSSTWTSGFLTSSLEASPQRMFVPASQYSSAVAIPLFQSALSVGELEKQMNEEDSRSLPTHAAQGHGPKTVAVSGLVSSHGGPFQPGMSSTLGEDKVKVLSSLATATTAAHHTSTGEAVRLLQPSVFAVPSSSTTASTSVISTSSQTPLLLPSSLASLAAIVVEPPSPVTIPSKGSAEGGFPAIPPLMHSPGMMAPPMSDSTNAKSTKKKAGGMPKRAASADSDSSVLARSGTTSPNPTDMTPSSNHSVPGRSLTAPNTATLMSPQQFLESRTTGGTTEGEDSHSLTREQFQKSLLYLVQNDESFLDKVYRTHLVLLQSSAKDQPPKYAI